MVSVNHFKAPLGKAEQALRKQLIIVFACEMSEDIISVRALTEGKGIPCLARELGFAKAKHWGIENFKWNKEI